MKPPTPTHRPSLMATRVRVCDTAKWQFAIIILRFIQRRALRSPKEAGVSKNSSIRRSGKSTPGPTGSLRITRRQAGRGLVLALGFNAGSIGDACMYGGCCVPILMRGGTKLRVVA